jgi:curved DNA-binding protein CbpA
MITLRPRVGRRDYEPDLYQRLGVARDASPAVIKRAYRKAAMECHPDRHPGDPAAEARFKRVTEAYEVLSSPERRHAYDNDPRGRQPTAAPAPPQAPVPVPQTVAISNPWIVLVGVLLAILALVGMGAAVAASSSEKRR